MDEVAAGAIGTEANTVVGFAEVCLVLGMSVHIADLMVSVGKLALLAILTCPILLEGSAHLCFVSAGRYGWLASRGGAWWCTWGPA